MSNAKTCPECLSRDLTEENINGHTTLICTKCGNVIDEHDIQVESYDSMPFVVNNSNLNELARNRRVGCSDPSLISRKKLMWGEIVEIFCKQLKFDKQMERQAVNYLHKAFDMKEFWRRHADQKHALCTACVYLTCRINNWAITVDYIAYVSSVDCKNLLASFKLLVQLLDVSVDAVKLEDIIPACLQENGLGKFKLEKQVQKIICLSQEAWLVTGRKPTVLILAAAYIVWKNLPENSKKTSSHFLKITQISGFTWKKRVKEIEDVLFKLVSKLPWIVPGNVNRKLVGLYVDDIMKYRLSLFSHFKNRSEEENDDEENVVLKMDKDPKLVSESQELTDLDLPESDMHIYIKSEQEILAEKIHFDNQLEKELPPKKVKTNIKRPFRKRKHDCIEEV